MVMESMREARKTYDRRNGQGRQDVGIGAADMERRNWMSRRH